MSDTEVRTRVYRSELRLRQAEETRRSIIDAAAELFSELGYAGTTLAKIAKRAGVSVETVQKTGPKAALIRAAVEFRSFGVEGDRDVFEIAAGQALLALTDRDEAAPLAARTMLEVNSGSAGVWTALTGAAHGDPELRGYFEVLLRDIRRQNSRILGLLAERGWLRDDVDFERAVDTWEVISSVETYVRLVVLNGRSDEEYRSWFEGAVQELIIAR
ncbi:TetR family transcriptional regulator [Agromyces ramosus]|uniref:TetR family transcriptional regulator n=1 Tax=Agromyces ramosus TaxID=33879 RepID=A0A4Q7MJ80_9MICO|nr:TetR/AcrR family transcriptional regulator [Agromyces ramosus]RZS68266.1 TetR family transcriptional regulator [Agromyces ramosus]